MLSHGDYTHRQVMFGPGGSGVVDFDGLCLAEPALDLGHFCAYLRVACRKAGSSSATSTELADRLCDHFLNAYAYAGVAGSRHADGAFLRERVAMYELISLARMALRSWLQLKAERTVRVLEVAAELSGPATLSS